MSELNKEKLFFYGWILWLIQNIILFIPLIASFPVLNSIVLEQIINLGLERYFSTGINYIFTFALLLDLVSIFLISLGIFSYFRRQNEKFDWKCKDSYIAISGFLWVVFSLIWRFPFYLTGGFHLGHIETFGVLDKNVFYNNLLNNQLMIIIQLFAAISLFFFLFSQEKYFKPLVVKKDSLNFGSDLDFMIGRETILGLINVISILFLLFGGFLTPDAQDLADTFGGNPNAIFLVIGMIFKITIVPLLVILVCLKMIGLCRFSTVDIIEPKTDNNKFNSTFVKRV